jgi:hypothetical protein
MGIGILSVLGQIGLLKEVTEGVRITWGKLWLGLGRCGSQVLLNELIGET